MSLFMAIAEWRYRKKQQCVAFSEKGVKRRSMSTKQAGGVAPGQPPNPAPLRQPCDPVTEPGCRAPRDATREFVRCSFMLLPLAILLAVESCGSIHLNPDPEVAPSGSSARVWTPSQSINVANQAAPKLPELRTIDEDNGSQALNRGEYDLPALVDLALRTNPQTRRTWYEAQAADAELGQSQAADYPKIAFDDEGGYLKLPSSFRDKPWSSTTRLFPRKSRSVTICSTAKCASQLSSIAAIKPLAQQTQDALGVNTVRYRRPCRPSSTLQTEEEPLLHQMRTSRE